MRVLNLVTNPDAEFFRQQIAVLERKGVECDVLPLPGSRVATNDREESRSVLDYVRYYPQVLRASFGDYDLVHANYGLTAPMALAQPNLPVVLTLWGSDILGKPAPLSRVCARFADATIVMTDEMARATGTPCYVIPHGIDLELFRPVPKAAARRAVGWRADARHVLFPYAKSRPVKDYPRAERVVERARELLARRPVAAEADHGQGASVQPLDDGTGRRETVAVELHAIHGVDHDRMPLYLNAADAVLMTSKTEGSPNAVKEALACNAPVVSTDVGDVARLVAGVTNATVAQSDEELASALADVLERGDPSTGRQKVEPLSLDRMGDRIVEVYEAVLE